MKRVTVTVEDGLLEAAKVEVAAGRAPSLSAWVADAMRHKLLARAELLAELEDMASQRPIRRKQSIGLRMPSAARLSGSRVDLA